jgi:hypothetical protein
MQPISLPKKITTCLIAALVASFAIQRIVSRTIWEFKNKLILPPIFIAIPILLVLLIMFLYAFYWHSKEKNKQTDFTATLVFWQSVIRFSIALDLSMIGWQKLFHLQFFTPLGVLDQPFSSFSGEGLTWAYFGHSYAFTCVVGLLQIAGSYLLLFKRTSLLGCFILFPVLLNIICIDFFYGLEAGELGHAIILFVGIIYLLLQRYKDLVAFFFTAKNNFDAAHFKNRLAANVVRLLVVFIPLLLIFSFRSHNKSPQIIGKYMATNVLINQKTVVAKSCADSVLTTVYFDKNNDIVFEFNSQQRRLIGSYKYEKENNHFASTWRYPSGQPAFNGTLIINSQNQITMLGKMGEDSVELMLFKTN